MNADIMKDTGRERIIWGLGLERLPYWGKERFSNTSDMQEYLKNSSAPEKIRKNRELLTREDEMAEFMFLDFV